MKPKLAIIFVVWPLLGNNPSRLVQVTKTERVNFAPGGIIHINDSFGGLNVEGWDRPEVEITVTKFIWDASKPKQQQEAASRLEGVQVVTKRSSETELTIST